MSKFYLVFLITGLLNISGSAPTESTEQVSRHILEELKTVPFKDRGQLTDLSDPIISSGIPRIINLLDLATRCLLQKFNGPVTRITAAEKLHTIKNGCAIAKLMHDNLIYHPSFMQALDTAMVSNKYLYAGNEYLTSYNFVSTFHYMVYLGYIPSLEFQQHLNYVVQSLWKEFTSKPLQELVKGKFNGQTENYAQELRNLSCVELTALLAATYAMIPVIHRNSIDINIKALTLNNIKKMLTDNKLTSIDHTKHDIFLGKIKQYLYWALLAEKESDLNTQALNSLNNFFVVGGRYNTDNNSCCSGAEFRFRGALLKLERSGLSFAQNVNPYDIKASIDAIIWNNDTLVFFELDGPFHFIRDITKPNQAPQMNGQTFLKTIALLQFGQVLRVSTKCDKTTFEARIKDFPAYVKDLTQTDRGFLLIDPENYANMTQQSFPTPRTLFDDQEVRQSAKNARLTNITSTRNKKQGR